MAKEESQKKEKQAKKKSLDLNQEVKRAIWAVVFFACFLISLLALLGKAGVVGFYLADMAFRLLGWGQFLLPFLFLGAVFLLFARKKRVRFILGISLILISFFGLLGSLNQEAGYAGVMVNYPLDNFGSAYVNGIILLAIFIIGLLILCNFNLFNKKSARAQAPEEEEEEKKAVPSKKREFKIKRPGLWPRKPSMLEPQPKVSSAPKGWKAFSLDLLDNRKSESVSMGNLDNNKKIIQETMENFGINIKIGPAQVGPTVTQYTFKPALGVKLSRITALHNDLALALAAHPIRIEAPIPGKALVGIEVPNQKVSIVRLGPLFKEEKFKKRRSNLSLALGRSVDGELALADLRTMPHLLVAGATGSGKTVALNGILLSLLQQNSREDLNLILIDPKRVELVHYDGIPHLLTPVITDHKQAVETLNWAVTEMEDRFSQLQKKGVRDIEGLKQEDKFPYLVIIIDELADLMTMAAREVESSIVRLAQMSRAVGIHLIVSTQRPSVNVITGLIKANITSRIAFRVASQIDSRTILDRAGAEKLLGNGDMLFLSRESAKPRRIQGALVTEKEIKDVVESLKENKSERIDLNTKTIPAAKLVIRRENINDDLYDDAKSLVIEAQRASASLIQRHLRVGYARAARLLDLLEANGIVGPHQGSRPRKVLIPRETV